MLRAALAVLAFLAFAHTAEAQGPVGREAVFNAYKLKVRNALVTVAEETGVYAGRARALFEVSSSGHVTAVEVTSTDKRFKPSLRRRVASVRVPPPPAWIATPIRFGVTIVFNPS